MIDYKATYLKLFNAITDANRILQNAQSESEETFLDQKETEVILLKPDEETPEPH